MTRKRLIYLVILAVGVAVLLWDKAHRNTGVSVCQGNPPAGSVVSGGGTASSTEGPVAGGDIQSISKQVRQALLRMSSTQGGPIEKSESRPLNLRDLFVVPDDFKKGIADQNQKAQAGSDEAEDVFPADLKLRGIIQSDRCKYALIGEYIVREGQAIGPYRLETINSQNVIFRKEDRLIILSCE